MEAQDEPSDATSAIHAIGSVCSRGSLARFAVMGSRSHPGGLVLGHAPNFRFNLTPCAGAINSPFSF
jgi:hypothetical protein